MSDAGGTVTVVIDPSEARIEAIFTRVMNNHEARLLHLERVMSRKHTVATATIAGLTSVVVALISALL